MFPKPKPQLKPNTYAYESEPMVKATGFREYDARWLFGSEINLMGVEALGLGLGTLIHELGVKPEVVTGHDSPLLSRPSIKMALVNGLLRLRLQSARYRASCRNADGFYFAQFDLDVPCVAMVTASHNDNGWTGREDGVNCPLTFGPDEMARLKDIVLNGRYKIEGRWPRLPFVENFPARSTSPTSPTGRSSSATSPKSFAPAATAPPAHSRRRFCKRPRLRGRSARLRA